MKITDSLAVTLLVFLETVKKIHMEPNNAWDSEEVEPDTGSVVEITELERQNLSETLSLTLDRILNGYDNRLRPNFYGPPIQIQVGLIIKGISSVSEVKMEQETDFYFHQSWEDPRLKFNTSHHVRVLTLTHATASKIWQPDTYFPNEKDSRVHSATVDNEFFRWYSNGRVFKSTRLTLLSTCPMSLENFPMDRQICAIELGSYGLTDFDINYTWKDDPAVTMGPNAGRLLTQFTVLGHHKSSKVAQYSIGNFTYLQCAFMFARSKNYYLIEVYIPCMLIVVISWFPFWMGAAAAAERIGLGLTSMLTITTLLLSSHSSSPKISYIKALDIYGGVCYAMVFASLLQSAIICYVMGKQLPNPPATSIDNSSSSATDNMSATWGSSTRTRVSERTHKPVVEITSRSAQYFRRSLTTSWRKIRSSVTYRFGDRDPESLRCHDTAAEPRQKRHSVQAGDKLAKCSFPIMFLMFNLIYWGYYLNASKHHLGPEWVKLDP